MDIGSLRELLRPAVGDMKDECTNNSMPEFCARIGLPVPPDGGDKRGRLHAAFDALPDAELPRFARNLVDRRLLGGGELRNSVQALLWEGHAVVEIPKRQRRELARALQAVELFHHWEHFAQLLRDVFIIPQDLGALIFGRREILDDIHQHFVRNPEDADVEALFEQLNAFDLSDLRFAMFLEGLASADVQVDVAAQQQVVDAMNAVLSTCGAEMRETAELGDYPVFTLVSLRTATGRPKNLIFASQSKPDIRFRDAVSNDIEIASNPDDVLVYDRPLSSTGLRWNELQDWWADATREEDPECAKRSLYRRLLQCLPESSPPQRLLFQSFFRGFGAAVPQLPALLPEVWLHWDPKTVAQRGANALLHHRMDFLMLLPGGARVVIEVDGVQHYADANGVADTHRYARLTAGDRELKLAGYEVFRFAGVELQGPSGPALVKDFFDALFKRHHVA